MTSGSVSRLKDRGVGSQQQKGQDVGMGTRDVAMLGNVVSHIAVSS